MVQRTNGGECTYCGDDDDNHDDAEYGNGADDYGVMTMTMSLTMTVYMKMSMTTDMTNTMTMMIGLRR